MSVKLALPVAALTVLAMAFAVVHWERTAPLSDKPSIRLRVWSGELPTADLQAVRAQEEAKAQTLKAELARMQEAAQQQAQLGQALTASLQQLQERIEQKQSTQWVDASSAAVVPGEAVLAAGTAP